MDVEFAYDDIGKSTLGHILRPVAKVTFNSLKENQKVDIWMIVDTGADYTILPRHFADKLRVSLEDDCFKDTTYGVGGGQDIYFCKKKIKVTIGNFLREIPLAFFDNNEVPALLGRLGFLETFNTEFLKKHIVKFKS
jgi:predicted aspartyl protease